MDLDLDTDTDTDTETGQCGFILSAYYPHEYPIKSRMAFFLQAGAKADCIFKQNFKNVLICLKTFYIFFNGEIFHELCG
ncbi:MAG: hypothetical protein QMD09_04515, partial [Desulfatibacillaceae bacterium]|nr:hypothetical protein [Desulfatibacillaceae bacterium]